MSVITYRIVTFKRRKIKYVNHAFIGIEYSTENQILNYICSSKFLVFTNSVCVNTSVLQRNCNNVAYTFLSTIINII